MLQITLLVSELKTLLAVHSPTSSFPHSLHVSTPAPFPLDLPSSFAWLHASQSALLDSFYFMLSNTGKEYNYVIFLHKILSPHHISVRQRPRLKDMHFLPLNFRLYALLFFSVPKHSSHIDLDLSSLISYLSSPTVICTFLLPHNGMILLFHPLHLIAI